MRFFALLRFFNDINVRIVKKYSWRSVFFTKTHVSVIVFCEKYTAPTVFAL